MLGQPNRVCRDRWASIVSCHRPCGGGLRSLCFQPMASDLIGSVFTCASWIRPHLVHRTVQCSNPERAEAICWISMRDWHLRQRGRAATGSDKAGVCGSGIYASRFKSGRFTTELSVTDECRNGAEIVALCRSSRLRLCSVRSWSILLTFEDLIELAEFEPIRLSLKLCVDAIGAGRN
jgi:hypothetical protein